MSVTVSSPSRLHFGLFSVGKTVDREFGGIGLMVKEPRTEITTKAARRFLLEDQSADALHADRVAAGHRTVRKWIQHFGQMLPRPLSSEMLLQELPVHLTITEACPRHNGLGSGTQLAFAVALALQHHFGLPQVKPDEIAIATGRAGRSAIGTYGCLEGGFLVDRGKATTEIIAPVDLRIDFPEHWPIVLVFPACPAAPIATAAGLHGVAEVAAFEKIPPTSQAELEEMRSIVKTQIVPSLIRCDYMGFGQALQAFGRRSGDYFKSVQGGTFANPTIEAIIDLIAHEGIPAVGQTSWGPCVFAITPTTQQIDMVTNALTNRFGADVTFRVTRADNRGTIVTRDNA